jgi:hypothetical protein
MHSTFKQYATTLVSLPVICVHARQAVMHIVTICRHDVGISRHDVMLCRQNAAHMQADLGEIPKVMLACTLQMHPSCMHPASSGLMRAYAGQHTAYA